MQKEVLHVDYDEGGAGRLDESTFAGSGRGNSDWFGCRGDEGACQVERLISEVDPVVIDVA